MRISIVLSYPIYHASPSFSIEEWINQSNREFWMAKTLSQMGHQVELLSVDFQKKKISSDGFNILAFPPSLKNQKRKKTKYHFSESLVNHSLQFPADFYIIKGLDGGVGNYLLKKYLLPHKKSFALIIGGEYYTKTVSKAKIVFYETQMQKIKLLNPGIHFWRKKIHHEKLIRFPKFIDTSHFSPQPDTPKKWDILVVGRLISRYKNYEALGHLSNQFQVAVAGDGSEEKRLKALYPKVEWLGYIPHKTLPQYYNQAHLFMHTSYRDYYPRVIAEALSCGLPCVAFSNRISLDVLPVKCGLLVSKDNYTNHIKKLLENKDHLTEMGRQARRHALNHIGELACRKALNKMIIRLKGCKEFKGIL